MEIINKLIKYIVGGLSNTIFSYLFYCLLVLFVNYKIAYFISTVASIIYTYKINTKLVFEIKSNSKARYLFFLIYIFQIIVGIFLIDLWINNFLVSKFIAPILNIIFISPISFLLSILLSNKLKSNVNK